MPDAVNGIGRFVMRSRYTGFNGSRAIAGYIHDQRRLFHEFEHLSGDDMLIRLGWPFDGINQKIDFHVQRNHSCGFLKIQPHHIIFDFTVFKPY